MKYRRSALAAIGLSALVLLGSYAAQSAEQIDAAASQSAKAVFIVEDQEAKAFRFMIEGEEVARIDATGLHVKGDIEYSGVSVDIGNDTDLRSANVP